MMNIAELTERFNVGEFTESAPTEADFKRIWCSFPRSSPVIDAFHGGLLADRLSWVFVAAYQSAVRACFSDLPLDDYVSFAVSEDRQGEFPGVQITEDRLTGHKSWVACSRTVDRLLVTVGTGLDSVFNVPVSTPGVQLTHRDQAGFLGEMSQGRARFSDVDLDSVERFTTHDAKYFGLAEPFFVMAAACGFLLREHRRLDIPTAGIADCIGDCMNDLEALYEKGFYSDVKELLRLYRIVGDTGKQTAEIAGTKPDRSATDWQINGRLLGLYGRNLRSRLESVG